MNAMLHTRRAHFIEMGVKGHVDVKKNVVIQNKTHLLNLVSMNIKGVIQSAECEDRKNQRRHCLY